MVSLTERDVFKLFADEDVKSRYDKLDLNKCKEIIKVNYSIDLTESQREIVKQTLRKYQLSKKRNYQDKKKQIDWKELVGLGNTEELLFIGLVDHKFKLILCS